jgi:hypothetical protein
MTLDETGANLPVDQCTGAWQRIKSVAFEGGLPPWGIDAAWQDQEAAVRAGLAENGFFITEGEFLPHLFR